MQNDYDYLLRELQLIRTEFQRIRKELDDLKSLVNNIDRNTNKFHQFPGAPIWNPQIPGYPRPFIPGEITC